MTQRPQAGAADEPTLFLLDNILSGIKSSTVKTRTARRPRPRLEREPPKTNPAYETGLRADVSPIRRIEPPSTVMGHANEAVPDSFQRRIKELERNQRQLERAKGSQGETFTKEADSDGGRVLDEVSAPSVGRRRNSTEGIQSGGRRREADAGQQKEWKRGITQKGGEGEDSEEEDDDEAENKMSEDDQLAVTTMGELSREVHEWVDGRGGLSETEPRREAFANYLTTKYLCSRLDALPKSPVVTSVRRKVSRCVEEISSGRDPRLVLKAVPHSKQRQPPPSAASGGGGGGGGGGDTAVVIGVATLSAVMTIMMITGVIATTIRGIATTATTTGTTFLVTITATIVVIVITAVLKHPHQRCLCLLESGSLRTL